jgi:hypothetical protein
MKNPLIHRFVMVAASASILTILCGGLRLIAQEPKAGSGASKTDGKTAKRAYDPARRLPPYFRQVGLSEAQVEEVYRIQGKHMPKITDLLKQVDDLRAQMLSECEGVLQPEQKKLLEQRRAAAAEAKSKGRSAAKKSS